MTKEQFNYAMQMLAEQMLKVCREYNEAVSDGNAEVFGTECKYGGYIVSCGIDCSLQNDAKSKKDTVHPATLGYHIGTFKSKEQINRRVGYLSKQLEEGRYFLDWEDED